MKLAPLAPVRQQERAELEVLALHRTRNGFQAGTNMNGISNNGAAVGFSISNTGH
jgi:hypothetical protein